MPKRLSRIVLWASGLLGTSLWTWLLVTQSDLNLAAGLALGAIGLAVTFWVDAVRFPAPRPEGAPVAPGRLPRDQALEAAAAWADRPPAPGGAPRPVSRPRAAAAPQLAATPLPKQPLPREAAATEPTPAAHAASPASPAPDETPPLPAPDADAPTTAPAVTDGPGIPTPDTSQGEPPLLRSAMAEARRAAAPGAVQPAGPGAARQD